MLRRAAVPAAIAVTFATFLPAVLNDFVELDDLTLFLENEHYRGLGWPQLSWMATAVRLGHYEPVTWLTHASAYVLWGLSPAGHHLVNVALHAANAMLFYFLSLRLLRLATAFGEGSRRLAAAGRALFFALHPLRAASSRACSSLRRSCSRPRSGRASIASSRRSRRAIAPRPSASMHRCVS